MTIRLAEYFQRPLRLTPAEGLALLAAGRALLAVPGSDPDGPLGHRARQARGHARRRGRLAVDVGAGATTSNDSATRPPTTSSVEIDYWSSGTRRADDPRHRSRRVFPRSASGTSRPAATAPSDERMFRVDRIRRSAPRARTSSRRPAPTTTSRTSSTRRSPTTRGSRSSWRPTPAGSPRATRPSRPSSARDGTWRGRARGERAGVARAPPPAARPRRRGRRRRPSSGTSPHVLRRRLRARYGGERVRHPRPLNPLRRARMAQWSILRD